MTTSQKPVAEMSLEELERECNRAAWMVTCIVTAAPNLAALDTFDVDRLRKYADRANECQDEASRRIEAAK